MINASNNPFSCEPAVIGLNNQILELGTISRVDDTFTFSTGFKWMINSNNFENTSSFDYTPASATTDFKRIDIAVLNTNNEIEFLAGTESDTIALRPTIPVNNLLLTQWNINGSTIEDNNNPLIGADYIKKSFDFGYANPSVTGSNAVIPLPANGEGLIVVNNNSLVSIDGFNLSLITGNPSAEVPHINKKLRLFNATANAITLVHNGTAEHSFLFRGGANIVIPPNEFIELLWGNDIQDGLRSWSSNSEDVLEQISSTQDVIFELTTANSYVNNLGNVVASANWRTSEFINVDESVDYRYFGRTNIGGAAYAVAAYNSSNNFVSMLLGNTVNGASGVDFTIPVGIAKIRICSYFDTTLDLIKLEPKIAVKQEYIDVDYINSIVIHPEVNVGKEPISKTWASVGTSITSNNDSPSLKGYQENVLTVFELDGFTNYGYSGYSLAGTSVGDVSAITNSMTSWVAHDIFSMESITNDFKRNIPIGVLDDYTNNTGITTYYGALRVFKDRILTLNNQAIVVVANALKRNNGGYTSTSANTQGHTLADYEIALLTVAQLNNWRFIDQFRESGITDENLFATTSDGLHPNNFGYSILSKVWVREFWFLKYL